MTVSTIIGNSRMMLNVKYVDVNMSCMAEKNSFLESSYWS